MNENNVKVDFIRASVFDLPYSPNFFDIIIDYGLLHHFRKSQWNKYLKNILKVIKPEGYFCLHCFSTNAEYLKPKNRNWALIGKHYSHFFSEPELQSFFGKHFNILEVHKSKHRRRDINKKLELLDVYMQRK